MTPPAATAPAPAKQPTRVLPDATPGTRPSLRVVPPPAHGLHVLLASGLLLVFVILLATASLHTLLVAGQRDLDTVNTRIGNETRRNEALQLKLAKSESPERIVDAARADGMIDPDTVTWLSPRPGGRTEQSVTERPEAPEDDQGNGTSDVRAGGSGTGAAGTDDATAGDAAGDASDGGQGGGGHEGDGSGA